MIDLNGKTKIILEQEDMLNEIMAKKISTENVLIDRAGADAAGIDMNESARVARDIERRSRINAIAGEYEVITKYSADVIDIGTRFRALLKDQLGKEEEEFILIHKRVASEPRLYLTCEGSGIQFFGKKVNDTFKIGETEVTILKIYANRLGQEKEQVNLKIVK